jgi:hypothetical protein
VRRSILCFVALLGVTAALTVMFLSMREVMDIGGSCGSGNVPYQVTRPCPTGVPGLMVGSIFLGLLFLGVYAVTAVGPNLTLLAWPALFLSLGWNFLDYGVDPPDGTGLVWGWLICGVVFMAMGGVPLVGGILAMRRGRETRAIRAQARLLGRSGSAPADADDARRVWRYGLALQLVAIAVGIWAGIRIFEWGTDTTVTIHLG